MESMKIKETVISRMPYINIMSGLAFLNSSSHTAVSLASCEAKEHIEDVDFIKLGCYLDGSTVDWHISQQGIDLQFCFKLLQSSYNPSTGDIISLTTPGTPAKSVPFFTIKLIFNEIGEGNDDEDVEDEAEDDTASSSTPKKLSTIPSGFSPKMSRLIGSTSLNLSITGFFGPMSFLDDQRVFDSVSGKNLIILGLNPHDNSLSNCLTKARLYAEKCILDMFLHICKEDYIGGNNASSEGKLIHEICKSISSLWQEYNEREVGRNSDTPDELYAKYISIVASLLDDASPWYVSLCSTYYSALNNNLKDNMDELSFSMPALNSMNTKALQIEGLRHVRTSAVTSLRSLIDEEKIIRRLFSQLSNRPS